MNYEYMTDGFNTVHGSLTNYLNRMGEEGWELCACFKEKQGEYLLYQMIWKRPK
jgi:hypothetical protein